jgi:uncharacterized protein (DUF1778 family)
MAKRTGPSLSIRLPRPDIAIIDRAATLRGCSRAEFVREAAVRAAEDVLMEAASIQVSSAGFKSFTEVLSQSARPVPEIVELVRRTAPWESRHEKAEK